MYLCHPFLVHAAQAHRGRNPNFMAQPPLRLREPCVLDRLCAEIGRDPREIRKSCVFAFDLGPGGGGVGQVLGQLKRMADMGIDLVIGRMAGVDELTPLEMMGREVIPVAAEFGR